MDIIANSKLYKNDNTVVSIANKTLIGLYFSASYCPPCKLFTPILIEKYIDITQCCNQFEIILIPCDKSESSRKEYFSNMPWPSIDPVAVPALKKHFSVLTIPALIFIDADGNVIDYNGVALVKLNTAKDIIESLVSF